MQFHLNVMTCHLCTSLPPDSGSGAENHKGSFWISIRQIYTYHRVNLFKCAEDLSVQLVFSISLGGNVHRILLQNEPMFTLN